MEFKISNDILKKAVNEVSRVISTNDSVLSGIKIKAGVEGLTITAGNSDITVERFIPNSSALKIYQFGSVLVSGKYLGELIKKLPSNIYLKMDKNHSIIVQSSEILTRLNAMDPEDYPKPYNYLEGDKANLPGQVLMELIRHTEFATAKAETKPVLTGVHFLFQDGQLTCVATNSQRLSLKRHEVYEALTGSYVIPRKTLVEVGKLIGNYEEEIDIYFTNNTVVFKTNTLTVYSKLIEGRYPDVSNLISQVKSTTIVIDRLQLLRGIERASIFSSGNRNNNVSIKIEGKSKVKISSGTTLAGELEETQECRSISGMEELTVTMDARYLIEALQVIPESEVKLCFNGSLKPILIYPVGDECHIQLISPVRTA